MCHECFCFCFEARGWPAIETPEVLADWATEPELGPCNTSIEKLAHKIVGLYKGVYYAHRRAKVDKASKRIATKRSMTVQRETREKLAADLVSEHKAWAAKHAVLLWDKEMAEQKL